MSHTPGMSRRDLLRLGAAGVVGCSMSGWFEALAAGAARDPQRKRACILLWMSGGPSQMETFDPKPDAPKEVRPIFGEVQTSLPGVLFGATFPKLAKQAHRTALVRSFASGNGDHQKLLSVAAGNPLGATMGALYSRVVGPISARTGMLSNVFVPAEAVSPGVKMGKNFETTALPQLASGGRIPTPRKLSPASSVMTTGTFIEASTTIGPMMLGSTWKNMMRGPDAPRARSASRKGRSLTVSVWARATRPNCGTKTAVTRMMMFVSPGPSTATSDSARMRLGNELTMSNAARMTRSR